MIKINSNGEMKPTETEDDEMEELPLLFCKEQQVCWNTVESQYYAAEKTPTRGGRVQTIITPALYFILEEDECKQ